jgi:predicted GIY-YIG superfamily endonuclease
MAWFVYILECANSSLYVGSTSNPRERFARHVAGDGASHTKKTPPTTVIYTEELASRAAAVCRERQLKGWSRAKKLALAAGDLARLRTLSRHHGL